MRVVPKLISATISMGGKVTWIDSISLDIPEIGVLTFDDVRLAKVFPRTSWCSVYGQRVSGTSDECIIRARFSNVGNPSTGPITALNVKIGIVQL